MSEPSASERALELAGKLGASIGVHIEEREVDYITAALEAHAAEAVDKIATEACAAVGVEYRRGDDVGALILEERQAELDEVTRERDRERARADSYLLRGDVRMWTCPECAFQWPGRDNPPCPACAAVKAEARVAELEAGIPALNETIDQQAQRYAELERLLNQARNLEEHALEVGQKLEAERDRLERERDEARERIREMSDNDKTEEAARLTTDLADARAAAAAFKRQGDRRYAAGWRAGREATIEYMTSNTDGWPCSVIDGARALEPEGGGE